MPKKRVVDEFYKSAVDECIQLADSASKSAWERVEANFALGALVDKLTADARYGDKVVPRLAMDISRKRGRQVYATQLYECRMVAQYFGSIEVLEKFSSASGTDITWNTIVKRVKDEADKKESEDAAKTKDPKYLIYKKQAKTVCRNLRKYIKQEEITPVLHLELKDIIDELGADAAELAKLIGGMGCTKQTDLFAEKEELSLSLN